MDVDIPESTERAGIPVAETEFGDSSPALPAVIESLLFAASEPVKLSQLARAAGGGVRQEAVRAAIDELNVFYLESGRAYEIVEISGCFQMLSRPEYLDYIGRLRSRRETPEKGAAASLTPPILETLAIIAYKQPVTRADIERIRGVGCDSALRLLLERGSITPVGKKNVVGQPRLYGTTDTFLSEFGLGSLEELPHRDELTRQVWETENASPLNPKILSARGNDRIQSPAESTAD
ncbi:MAG: SMC-Scp complex subunit ScpB [Planctomycetota bacterium]|jgi:segregation and condensation protein B|nr:SMC-Scp complex subunit ScpB [Planctomycetota bacterium]